MAQDQRVQISVDAKDNASGVFDKIRNNFSSFGDRMDAAAGASKAFAVGLAGVTASFGALGVAAISGAADLEQTKIAFTTMLGSAEKANKMIKDLTNFAKTTPFELKGLETASKQLLAYGFTQEELLPRLKDLGDIAAGVGMDKLPNLILAFGQVRAATRLTGMELRQFTEAGVPLLQALSDTMHKPVMEIQELVSAGAVGFPEVQAALQSLTGEGGRFNNLMENQSKSLNGMISNLKDAWSIFLRGEGQALIEWAKQFVAFAIDIVQNHLPKWIERIKEIIEFFKQHKEVLIIVAGVIIGALVPAIYAAVTAFAAAAVALAPFIIGGAIIGGLVAGIVWLVNHWDLVKQKVEDVWNFIESHIALKILFIMNPIGLLITLIVKLIQNWDNLKASTMAIWNAIANFFKEVWATIQNIFNIGVNSVMTILNPFISAAQQVISLASSVKGALSTIGSGVSNAASSAVSSVKGLLGFASGGIVPGPLGAAQLAIVHGGETVIPANGLRSNFGSGGGITVNITGNNISSDMDLRDIADRVGREIVRTLQLNIKI